MLHTRRDAIGSDPAGSRKPNQRTAFTEERKPGRIGSSVWTQRTGMGFLETGKRWPRLDTLMSVANGLNITVDELLKGLHKPPRRR